MSNAWLKQKNLSFELNNVLNLRRTKNKKYLKLFFLFKKTNNPLKQDTP